MSDRCKEVNGHETNPPAKAGGINRRDFFIAGAVGAAIAGISCNRKDDDAREKPLAQKEIAIAADSGDTVKPIKKPEIRTQNIGFNRETGERSSILFDSVLPGEVHELTTEAISITGPCSCVQAGRIDSYDVLLIISGKAIVTSADHMAEAGEEQIIRPPYGEKYRIEVKAGDDLKCLRIRKALTAEDIEAIRQAGDIHSGLYSKKYTDCQAYTEAIKSAKTINRMLLPEGYLPRLCMGLVETTGPDSVGAHEHPMLDQLFFGLKNCRCTCHADGAETLLLENTLLHIPLGSKHSASVEPGALLSYIWMDMFLTTEGQSYMSSQHKMVGQEQKQGGK
jgi:hypothetical protein